MRVSRRVVLTNDFLKAFDTVFRLIKSMCSHKCKKTIKDHKPHYSNREMSFVHHVSSGALGSGPAPAIASVGSSGIFPSPSSHRCTAGSAKAARTILRERSV